MVDPQTFVLAGTHGGQLRARILGTLAEEPHTVAELSAALGAEPARLREHLAVLESNDMVTAVDRPEAAGYVPTEGAPSG